MEEFFIHIKAPFAAYRYFQAGNYRTTMPTIPHSAAYGLILNFAGIEMRTAVNEMTTLIKNVVKDYSFENEDFIPSLEIAIGDIENAKKGSVYQQLHTYPVGDASKGFREGTKGAKYHIIPTRREFLVGLNTMIGVRTNLSGFMKKIQSGLNGDIENRYGLPFAVDNNLLFNFLEIYEEAIYPATWYYPVTEDEIPETETVRLTVGIDRLNNSKTTAPLFATTKEKSLQPPPNAWVWTPKEPESI
ncbi:CRISPR-associated protein Cas5 [Leptospira kirschneri]|uniref:CRISPR-associated protein Cas5 n=1 Tax=Leptospira kirschneri TaxID=29507 RepID=UPI0040368659